MFVCPLNSQVGGGIRRPLGGLLLMNAVSLLITEAPGSLLVLSYIEKKAVCELGSSPQTQICRCHDLGLLSLQNCEK